MLRNKLAAADEQPLITDIPEQAITGSDQPVDVLASVVNVMSEQGAYEGFPGDVATAIGTAGQAAGDDPQTKQVG